MIAKSKPRQVKSSLTTAKASASSRSTKRNAAVQKSTSDLPAVAKKFRRPKVFGNSKLEQVFNSYMQLLVADSFDFMESRTRRLERLKIEFIVNASFATETAEAEILGCVLLGSGVITETQARLAELRDLPTHLARLCESRLLSPEEERNLFQRMNYLLYTANRIQATLSSSKDPKWTACQTEALLAAAEWYRDLIIKSNMRLVISIVKKFVNSNNSFDDLLSDGIVALMRAVDKFDYDRGFRFSTYATQVVRRNSYRTVMQKQKDRLKVNSSIQEKGIDVSDERSEPAISIDRWNELRSRLVGMVDHLDRREKLIVRARFSLGGHKTVQTLQRLADKLGVSKERVRQLEKRALDKLREMASDETLSEIET